MGTTATDVGDFTTLLLDINPTYTLGGYPNAVWTNFVVTLSGLGWPIKGRLAFRYFVENGGPSGANSDYIGIDTVQYACNGGLPTPSANTDTVANTNATAMDRAGQCIPSGFTEGCLLLTDGTVMCHGVHQQVAALEAAGNQRYRNEWGEGPGVLVSNTFHRYTSHLPLSTPPPGTGSPFTPLLLVRRAGRRPRRRHWRRIH